MFTVVLAAVVSSALAQNAPPPSASATLRPALAQISQALEQVNPSRWRAPRQVKSVTDGDINAIQRDLSGPLPGLMQQADAAPGSVPAQFRVYRNVDALYDTLLRVVETADMTAPADEATGLQSALQSLEQARSQLGDTLMAGAQAQESQLTTLQTAIQRAAAAQRTPVKTTVVNDWDTRREERRPVRHYVRPEKRKTPVHSKTSEEKKPNPQ